MIRRNESGSSRAQQYVAAAQDFLLLLEVPRYVEFNCPAFSCSVNVHLLKLSYRRETRDSVLGSFLSPRLSKCLLL